MKINAITCVFIILCLQLLIVSSLGIDNKLSASEDRHLDDVHGAVTVGVIYKKKEGNPAIVESGKSQGKRGSGGGNNVVHNPGGKKNNGVSTMPLSFFISVCFSFVLFLLLSF